MKRRTAALFAALCALGFADSWKAPQARIFASANGQYAIKVVPPPGKFEGKARAVLFSLEAGGKEARLWSADLVNIPATVWVSDTGRAVGLDTYGRVGYSHAVVVYGDIGEAKADYKLEELLTPHEIRDVPTSVSSRWWSESRTLSHEPDGEWTRTQVGATQVNRPGQDILRIGLKSGPDILIDLESGKASRAP
ncbi:MAG TPA: hypothetical protein VGE01_07240 [Fimbriimonas sp.]